MTSNQKGWIIDSNTNDITRIPFNSDDEWSEAQVDISPKDFMKHVYKTLYGDDENIINVQKDLLFQENKDLKEKLESSNKHLVNLLKGNASPWRVWGINQDFDEEKKYLILDSFCDYAVMTYASPNKFMINGWEIDTSQIKYYMEIPK
jgi:hypothetical protein